MLDISSDLTFSLQNRNIVEKIKLNIEQIKRTIQWQYSSFNFSIPKCELHKYFLEMADEDIDLYGDLDDYDLTEQLKKVSGLILILE